MSTGKIVALVISLVVLVPLLVISAVLGISYLRYLGDTQAQNIDLSEPQAVPGDPDAFLDDRYAEGAREISVNGVAVNVKGFTSDREQLVVWSMPEGLGTIASQNILEIYDVTSGELANVVENLSACSRVTPDDTIFCTQQRSPEGMEMLGASERRLIEIDLATADVLRTVGLDPIGTQSIEYLGDADGAALLEIISTDGLGAPTYSTLHSLPESGDAFDWTVKFDETKEVIDNCMFAESASRIVCGVMQFSDEGSSLLDDVTELLMDEEGNIREEFLDSEGNLNEELLGEAMPEPSADEIEARDMVTNVQTFDTATGDMIANLESTNFPTFAADGWADFPAPTGGVSLDGSGSLLDGLKIYDYDGTDITEQYAQQIKDEVGQINLVPVPNRIGSEPLVTYPIDSIMQGSILDTIVIDGEGTPILESDAGVLETPSLDGPTMKQVDGGKELFTGTPLGVTKNGAAVLYQRTFLDKDGALVDVETGESIIEIVPGATLTRLEVEFGTIVYSESDDSTIVLLPGA